MSRVQDMAQARDNISVKYHEFMRICSKNKFPIFFEGEDEKYYSIRLDSLINVEWIGINCGGKKKVISLREKIKVSEAYHDKKALFFVDSDFDQNEEISKFTDVYITPCYSVENLYISDNAFIKILRSEFNISEYDENTDCYLRAIQCFKDRKREFIEIITDFNLLIHYLRMKEASGELTSKLNLNNINIDKLVSISLTEVKKIYSLEKYREIFPELPENFEIDLDISKSYLANKNSELIFRGKQNLDFFRAFILLLRDDRGKKSGRELFLKSGKVKLQLTKANTLSELSQYADTPTCLKKFLAI
ncbi:DUF4435 domain-containing protein [Acinetobacter nosocomialis]|nr:MULTISPECIES: DUF4435 domain-containing protein [Acinetobacter calcoaceticus/baumannii complex]MDC5065246.1 DUF4435 domain-containing protein [Acinetobacter baumannii]PZL91985.1 hypothetical protein DOL91_07990 [Acinetobacter baumannii]HEM7142612.1 DUF4435 domain-containing protein [Acinetobacter nosocomialis]